MGISGSAVREHLKRLTEEGLVRHGVERRGVGKPTHVYELTAEGHHVMSRAYVPVLGAVLGSVESRLGTDAFEEVMRSAGRWLATHSVPPRGSAEQRAALAAAALEELGASVAIGIHDETIMLQGNCCPLAPLTSHAPSLCRMLESMLGDISGLDVREQCDREVPPRCRFEIRRDCRRAPKTANA
jgi:predicted ArsR family transcriptional regulator